MQSDEQSKDAEGNAGVGGVGGVVWWGGGHTLGWGWVAEANGGLGWMSDVQVRVNRSVEKTERLGSCDRQRTRQIP